MHRFNNPLEKRRLRGKIVSISIKSQELKNLFNDPMDRECMVYIPPDFDPDQVNHAQNQKFPLLVDLAPFTNSGLGRVGWKNFGRTIPAIIDTLIHDKLIPQCIVAFPDMFTSLGGNQFVDSPILGRASAYIHESLVPELERKYNCGGEAGRLVMGKSSGGFGALYSVMAHPDFWDGAACHSGDIGFELAFIPDMAVASMVLGSFNHSISKFLNAFWETDNPPGDWIMTIMLLAMAGSYDPSDLKKDYGLRLPVDLLTLEVIPERFKNWLSFDPLMWDENQCEKLRRLKYLYIDCGTRDPYRLQFGARRFHQRLQKLGIDHDFEEFDGTHSKIDHRLEVSLPKLFKSLTSL